MVKARYTAAQKQKVIARALEEQAVESVQAGPSRSSQFARKRDGSPSRSSGSIRNPQEDCTGAMSGESTFQRQRIGREPSPSSAASRSTSGSR